MTLEQKKSLFSIEKGLLILAWYSCTAGIMNRACELRHLAKYADRGSERAETYTGRLWFA